MINLRLISWPKSIRLIQRVPTNLPLVSTIIGTPLQHGRVCLHTSPATVQARGAKTVSRRKVKDIVQGVVSTGLPPAQELDDAPRYPLLLQGVKSNMVKFDKCVVLTRVGNFYELYFEHAEEYGPLLGLKVASRSTALGPVAMAGFPFWQLDRFLKILVQDYNKYVAISEEFPVSVPERIKTGGLQYERKVARVVTPGTLIDENFLDPERNNFLLSVEIDSSNHPGDPNDTQSGTAKESTAGLAWLDTSTGDFFTQRTTYSQLPSVLMRLGPREILLSKSVPHAIKQDIGTIFGHSQELITVHEASTEYRSLADWDLMLESPIPEQNHSQFSRFEQLAGHRLLDYVRTRLQDVRLQLRPPRRKDEDDILNIDRGSLRGLEILETAKDGFGKGSLFHAVRRTVTKGGSRLLRDRLTAPSTSIYEIDSRLDLVARFYASEALRDDIIDCLRRIFDVKRLIQKFAANKGDADDMLCLARAIMETASVYERLQAETYSSGTTEQQRPLQSLLEKFNLAGPKELSQQILNAIDEEGLNEKHRREEDEDIDVADQVEEAVMKTAPEEFSSFSRKVSPKWRKTGARAHYEENEDPWIMRRSSSESLSRLHEELESLKAERTGIQERMRKHFNTTKLDLKWTPGLGHVCHITSTKAFDNRLLEGLDGRIVASSKSTRSLQLAEWSRLGERLAQSRLGIRDEEARIFRQLRQGIIKNLVFLRRNAAIIDELDVATSFAVLAEEQGWSRPRLNNSLEHKIVGGRHPTVKLGLEEQGRSFVSNDLFIGENERIWLVTGPNMAGKSTFLRQNALITILAQTGSFVPAEYAEIGLVDRIFSRIGAADDLFRDQSTFMVEMLETAAILKHATSRSFVIMDEVGRGTTPEDGTAVGFASLHHLYHVNKCRTLFATHFHALVDMTEDWPNIGRYCTDVIESPSGSFSFMHRLKPGVNRQSHALRVAKMAGLPNSALDLAEVVRKRLIEEKHSSLRDNA